MKKGFTLMELLAVIVVIGILSLIIIPMIGNAKKEAKENAIKASADLYIRGLSSTILDEKIKSGFNSSWCVIDSGVVYCSNEELGYKPKGNKASSGYVVIENGSITDYSICMDEYKITKAGKNKTITKDICDGMTFGFTAQITTGDITYKGEVYMDPTDLSAECTEDDTYQNINSRTRKPTGIKTGCMKFYIFDDTGDNYTMILDHNTSGNVAWITHDDYIAAGGTQADWDNGIRNNKGPVTANRRLKEDTQGWIGNPRLITADEVAHIVGADSASTINWRSATSTIGYFYLDGGSNANNTTTCSGTFPNCANGGWQKQYANSSNKSDYEWLYNYTYNCNQWGCSVVDNNEYPYGISNTEIILGYWTSSPHYYFSNSYAWAVSNGGSLGSNDDGVSCEADFGIRPVITIPKRIIESKARYVHISIK